MKVLLVLLVVALFGFAKADYQYAHCKFIEASNYMVSEDSWARLYSNGANPTSLNIEFHFNSTLTQPTQLAAQILTYGYNPNSQFKLGDPFNPTNKAMGCPGISDEFRAGDIGNLNSVEGFIHQNVTLTLPNIYDNPNSVIGRSIAIYSGKYQCDSVADSQIGSMIAYCTIGVGNVDFATGKWFDTTGTNTASFDTLNTAAIGLALVSNTTVTMGDFVEGKVLFKAVNATHMHVTAKISGLSYQGHGFHCHQFGDISVDNGQSIGGHYSKAGQNHGLPENSTRHYGDFGNFCAFNDDMSLGYYNYVTDYIKAYQVIGRGMAVHNFTDMGTATDLGGARCSQGIIALIEDTSFSLDLPQDWVYDVVCPNGAYKGGYDSSMEQSTNSENSYPGASSTIAPFIALVLVSIIFALSF